MTGALVAQVLAAPGRGFALDVATTRPRLFVRADDAVVGRGPTVSEVRLRAGDPEVAPYARLATSDANWEAILTPALQALLGGDPKALPQARSWLLDETRPRQRSTARQGPGHMAVAFDWLAPRLTADERRIVAENVRTGADAALAFLRLGEPDIVHNFTFMALFSVTAAGIALWDEPGFEAVGHAYLTEALDWLSGPGGVLDAGAALGGAWPEGGQYAFTESTRLLVLTLHALRSATDSDPFAVVRERYGDFLRGTGRFYMAMTRPDLTLERLGDVNQWKPLLRDQHRFVVEALASGLETDGGDALVPGMLRHFGDLLHEAYGARDTHRNFGWGMLTFARSEAPRQPAAYAAQPLLQVFGRGALDLVVIRNGWDANGVMLTFAAGDHFVDHQHFDKGAFTIYHRGALAIDAGAYDRMYSPHHSQYATRTVAHNAPLVFDPAQPVPPEYRRDGGQRVLRGFQHHARWTDFLAHRDAEHLDAADLLRCESGRAMRLLVPAAAGAEPDTTAAAFASFALAQADLAGAYGEAVRRLQRTLAYWPAAQVVVVDDQYVLESPLEVAFVLHTEEPLEPLGVGAPGGAGVVDFPEARTWRTTRTGRIDLGRREIAYDGRLFLQTIAPGTARPRRIGGKGFQWSVGGVNYSPGSSGLQPRESGAWRVEIASARAAARHHFAHALLIGDQSFERMPESRSLALPAGWRGVQVASAPEAVLVVAEGQKGGLPLAYTLETALPALHLVVGLEPGARVEVRAGDAARVLVTSREGVLAYHDPVVGAHRVDLAALGAP